MTVMEIKEVDFGAELPAFVPDTSLANVRSFCESVGWTFSRFMDHEEARKEGFSGAILPGIMSQGFLVAMIHNWAPRARIEVVDTIFRAPVTADEKHTINGVVTDIDEDRSALELDLTVTNEANETRVFGTATIVM